MYRNPVSTDATFLWRHRRKTPNWPLLAGCRAPRCSSTATRCARTPGAPATCSRYPEPGWHTAGITQPRLWQAEALFEASPTWAGFLSLLPSPCHPGPDPGSRQAHHTQSWAGLPWPTVCCAPRGHLWDPAPPPRGAGRSTAQGATPQDRAKGAPPRTLLQSPQLPTERAGPGSLSSPAAPSRSQLPRSEIPHCKGPTPARLSGPRGQDKHCVILGCLRQIHSRCLLSC